MSNRYSIIRHWDILISGFINTVHYIFAIKHTGTALDDQIIFSKVIRKICSAYQTYIQFLSKTFLSIRGIFTLPISSFRGAWVQHSAMRTCEFSLRVSIAFALST